MAAPVINSGLMARDEAPEAPNDEEFREARHVKGRLLTGINFIVEAATDIKRMSDDVLEIVFAREHYKNAVDRGEVIRRLRTSASSSIQELLGRLEMPANDLAQPLLPGRASVRPPKAAAGGVPAKEPISPSATLSLTPEGQIQLPLFANSTFVPVKNYRGASRIRARKS